MRSPIRHVCCASGLALVLVLASPAIAQTGDTAVATELFNAGRDLMKSGDFAAACPKLATSARLDPKVGTLARLAECEEKIGQIAAARGYWQQAINLARSQQDARLAHVEAEFARLDKTVPKLMIQSKELSLPGLSLSIDGVEVGAASLGLALPVEPGKHVLLVSATGKKSWTQTLDAKSDGALTSVAVPPLEDGNAMPAPTKASVPESVSSPADQTRGSSPLRTIGIVTAGAGVVALGVGAAFGVIAKNKLSDSNAQGCGANSNCADPGYGLRNDAKSAGNVSTVLFIAGGALAAGGVTMWLLAPKRGSAGTSSTAAVGVGPGSMMLRGSF